MHPAVITGVASAISIELSDALVHRSLGMSTGPARCTSASLERWRHIALVTLWAVNHFGIPWRSDR